MKQLLTISIAVLFCTFGFGQQQKKEDSLVLRIEMDTTTYKSMLQLIQENINGNTLTGKMVLQNIFYPLQQNLKLVPREATKPQEITPKKK